jgi:hypothetical protein
VTPFPKLLPLNGLKGLGQFSSSQMAAMWQARPPITDAAGWQLVGDEPDLGFVQYFLWVGPDVDERRLLSVGTPEVQESPHLYLPLSYFGDEGGDPSEHDRASFDDSYRRLLHGVSVILGPAERDGTYEYPHRPGWPYAYSVWRVAEAQVILLQDEHDIQFGMDVSLWLLPAEPDVFIPLRF